MNYSLKLFLLGLLVLFLAALTFVFGAPITSDDPGLLCDKACQDLIRAQYAYYHLVPESVTYLSTQELPLGNDGVGAMNIYLVKFGDHNVTAAIAMYTQKPGGTIPQPPVPTPTPTSILNVASQ